MTAGDVITISESQNGKKGNYFDGADDYVLHDAHAVARVAAADTKGTYSVWINTLKPIGGTILSAGDNNSDTEYLQLYIAQKKVYCKLHHGGEDRWKLNTTEALMTKKEWHHIAIVQDGTEPKIYVDGELADTSFAVTTNKTDWYNKLTECDKFAIGVLESNATHTQDFHGAIGRVKYFNLDLTADEIKRDYLEEEQTDRATEIETARVFDITMEDDGITDDGSGDDDGTLTGHAHYGGLISAHSLTIEENSTGHAAEFINTFKDGSKYVSIIKRGN